MPDAKVDAAVADIARKVELLSRPHPYLHGSRTVFGVMPDWNPAEMIGLRPRPCRLSLYRELITDAIWAYQRDNYGYRNLRSFPLLVSFHGLPYIDVRVSFNSFMPRDVSDDLAERLVNYYIDRLVAEPHLHDKVEFEIIFSCYTLDLPKRLAQARRVRILDRKTLPRSRAPCGGLTNRIIHGDTASGGRIARKSIYSRSGFRRFATREIDKISRIYWLLEDCKRYGTLPFAGLARAGFIAVQLLDSFVAVGVLDAEERADIHGQSRYRRLAHRTRFCATVRRRSSSHATAISGRVPTTSCRRATMRRPISISTGRTTAPIGPAAPRFALSIEQLRRIEQLLNEHELDIDVLEPDRVHQGGHRGPRIRKVRIHAKPERRSVADRASSARNMVSRPKIARFWITTPSARSIAKAARCAKRCSRASREAESAMRSRAVSCCRRSSPRPTMCSASICRRASPTSSRSKSVTAAVASIARPAGDLRRANSVRAERGSRLRLDLHARHQRLRDPVRRRQFAHGDPRR